MKEYDIWIYVITHKKIEVSFPKEYIPIQVGKLNTNENLPYINDNTGDNISTKNPNYCELTGIYWILKNSVNSNNIGIVHYRRFFKNSKFSSKVLSPQKANRILKKYDIILPSKFYFKRTVWRNYFEAGQGKEKDLNKLREIIKERYPEYISDFDKILYSNSASYCNMLITGKENFIKYHEWLFAILKELEKVTDLSNYSKSEARIYGYLSEILLNVWVKHNNLKVKYLDVKKVDNSFRYNLKWKFEMLKGMIWGKMNNV